MSSDTIAPHPTATREAAPKLPVTPPAGRAGHGPFGQPSLLPVVSASAAVLIAAAFIGLAISGGGDDLSATLTSRAVATGQDAETEPVIISPQGAVADFVVAWAAADWDALSAVADDSVVATVKEFHVEGGVPSVAGESSDTGGVVMYHDPAGGHGLLFNYVVAVDPSGSAHIAELTFAGDAG